MPSSGRKRKISQTPNENRNSNKKNSLDLVEMVKGTFKNLRINPKRMNHFIPVKYLYW